MISYPFRNITLDPCVLSRDDSVEVISTEKVSRDSYYENALRGLERMPMLPYVRGAVENDLRFDDHRSLYKLNNPTIIVHTFSPGDTRTFIITRNGNLLEKDNFWLRYFRFVRLNGCDGTIDTSLLNSSEEIISEKEYVWCPDDPNFTHLTVDMIAPLAYFCNRYQSIKILPYAHFSDTPSWQQEYLKSFGQIDRIHLLNRSQRNFLIFKPAAVYLPVMTSTLDRTVAMRDFLRLNSQFKQNELNVDFIPVFLTRNDNRAIRIRNADEIKSLVQKYGGFSIDPSVLKIDQKLELFSLPAVFIAEGSATNNIALFGLENTKLINLVDKGIIYNDCFIRSGWPYSHFMSLRTDYLIGQNTKILEGSPLASNIFDIIALELLIKNRINN
jgi:hypothetical protein